MNTTEKIAYIYTSSTIDLMKKFEDLFTEENPDYVINIMSEKLWIKEQMLLYAKNLIEDCRSAELKYEAGKFGFIPEQIEDIKLIFQKYLINDMPYSPLSLRGDSGNDKKNQCQIYK